MLKLSNFFALALFLVLIVGCGTKREYFEPKDEQIYADIVYTDRLPSPIKDVSRYGATLENRQIITKNGLSNVVLDDGYKYIGEFEDRLISADNNGSLHIKNLAGEKVYDRKFSRTVVVASVHEDRLAVVDAGNTLHLVNISEDKEYFTNKQDDVYALTAKVAAPKFLNKLAIFPTLDGKLVIVDWEQSKLIRDVVISGDRFFNNIIFLDIIDDRLIAATSKRALAISPSRTTFFDEDIKDILIYDEKVVIMSNDGKVIIADRDLEILKEEKFKFAVFVGAMSDGTLYLVERNGHLITSDFDLQNKKIYKLPQKVHELVFLANDTIFIDDSMSELHKE